MKAGRQVTGSYKKNSALSDVGRDLSGFLLVISGTEAYNQIGLFFGDWSD